MLGIKIVHRCPGPQYLPRLDFDVGGLPLRTARRLVDHDPRVGQRHPHAGLTGGQQETAHRTGLPNAQRADARADILHRVIDRHARRHHAAGRVDIQEHILLGVLCLQEQQLCHDERRHMILDLPGHEDDPFAQQPRINVERPFTAVRLLDDDRDEAHGGVDHDAVRSGKIVQSPMSVGPGQTSIGECSATEKGGPTCGPPLHACVDVRPQKTKRNVPWKVCGAPTEKVGLPAAMTVPFVAVIATALVWLLMLPRYFSPNRLVAFTWK